MKPQNLKTKIFLDSGDPDETKQAIQLLGFLDGQTTNPSLFAKKFKAIHHNIVIKEQELWEGYKTIISDISKQIFHGSVSIEVYADAFTSSQQMTSQARELNQWIPNAHIKLPTTTEGLKAASVLIKEGVRLNLTLVFSQEQAAAVYSVTAGAKRGDVFVSPFIGRLDDRGENGMDVINNIMKMYRKSDGHVECLTASVRTLDHFLASMAFGADSITVPFTILKEWKEMGMQIPDSFYRYEAEGKKAIEYKELDLTKPWESFNLHHDLTDAGLAKFAQDWKELLE